MSEFADLATQTSKACEKITIVWMVFGNKLLDLFLLLAIYLGLNCLCYRVT